MSFEKQPQSNGKKKDDLSYIGKKIALGAALTASSFSGHTKKTLSGDVKDESLKEISYDSATELSTDAANPFEIYISKEGFYESGETGDEKKKGKKKEKTKEEKVLSTIEGLTLDISAYFEESNPTLSPENAEKINNTVSNFLESLSQDKKNGLKNQTLKLVLYSESSNTNVREGGLELADGRVLMDNYELSLERGMNVFNATEKVFNDMGFGDIERKIIIPENGTSTRNVREVQMTIEAADVEISPEIAEMLINHPEFQSVYDADVIVIDESGSMKDDANAVRSFIEKVNKSNGKKLEEVLLLGGDKEVHAKTLSTLLEERKVLLISDEADSTIPDLFARDERRTLAEEQYKDYIDNLLKTSKSHYKMRIHNPDSRKGGFKEFSLNDHPYAMMPLDRGHIKYEGMIGRERWKTWYEELPDDRDQENKSELLTKR